MESETRSKKIEETVVGILKATDLEHATELSVRNAAAERLGLDLSDLDSKWLVRRVLESFLLSLDDEEEQTDEVVVRESEPTKDGSDDESRIICKLAEKRGVAVHEHSGVRYVSLRDYNKKGRKLFPSNRGISLSIEQWSTFRRSLPDIEAAIVKMESQIRSKDSRKQESDVTNSATPASEKAAQVEEKQMETDICNGVTASSPHGHIPSEAAAPSSANDSAPAGEKVDISPSQGLIPIQTTRLNGKNYYFWAHQMDFFLKQLKIAYVLTDPAPRSDEGEASQSKSAAQIWVDDDYLCRNSILNSLSDHLFEQYSKDTMSASDLWEDLKLSFGDDFGTKRSQVNKYLKFQMVDGIPVLRQVQELHNLADSIIASGMWVDENFHVSAIVSKLPPSWKELRVKLMREDFLPLNMLMHRLKLEEEHRSRFVRDEHLRKPHFADPRGENKLGPRGRDFKKPSVSREVEKEVTCYKCGKKGHFSRHCLQKKNNTWERTTNEVAPAPLVKEANMDEVNV